MKSKRKYIIIIIVVAIIGYYGPTLYRFYKYMYRFERNFDRFTWLFNDSAKDKLNTFIFSGKSRKRDAYYTYLYNNNICISIWELKDLSETDLKYDLIRQDPFPIDIKYDEFELFNKKLQTFPMITSKLGFGFTNSKMDVNLDNTSEIFRTIDTINYKGFFGKINKMSFSDAKGEHLILFEYKEPKKTLLLMYKARQSFFVIIVNSKTELDENIINIFNLK